MNLPTMIRPPALLLGASLLCATASVAAMDMDHSGHAGMHAAEADAQATDPHAGHAAASHTADNHTPDRQVHAGHAVTTPPAAHPDAHQDHAGHDTGRHASASPVPALTDADRAAVYQHPAGHTMHDDAWNHKLLAERLEWQDAEQGSALAWKLNGWLGGDIDRLWLRSEGERSHGRTGHAEVQALWGHAITPWWNLLGGVRQDFKPGSAQTWAAFGVQGMPLSGLETEATAFIGEAGQTALRLEAGYDLLLTNRLILQPSAEVNLYGRNDPQRDAGAGLADSELGLRLRYEIRREFAPYVGVTWNRRYGNSASYARSEGEDSREARLVLGVRLWF